MKRDLAHDQLTPRNIYVLPGGAVEIDAFPLPTSSGETLVSEPKYVSPEAFAEGVFSGMQLSIAGDIYVMGFVFYERLAGGKEFGKLFAQFSRGQNDIEWLRWHADQGKKLPPLRQFRPDCPGKLESLLEGMLAKAPDQRIKSLDEVASSLKELSSSLQETRLEPQPGDEPGQTWSGRGTGYGYPGAGAAWHGKDGWGRGGRGFDCGRGRDGMEDAAAGDGRLLPPS